MAKSKAKQRKAAATPLRDDNLEIGEDEQQRLIDQTGILKRASDVYAARPSTDPLGPAAQNRSLLMPTRTPAWTFWDEFFATVVIVMPLSFLLLLMHILCHVQYQQRPDYWAIAERMASSVPILSVFTFYTNRYKELRKTQFGFFLLCIAAGSRMVWVINNGNWRMNMDQTPSLGVIWVYTVVQLDLAPAVLGLAMVGLYTWLTGQHVMFNTP
ncbi:hypothetical protein PENSPDRAFT_655565 [Peniophora sp. CONT]|nr:hypothetical protein PENSPDRAFT_655565 [Peniophora sp. CONT]